MKPFLKILAPLAAMALGSCSSNKTASPAPQPQTPTPAVEPGGPSLSSDARSVRDTAETAYNMQGGAQGLRNKAESALDEHLEGTDADTSDKRSELINKATDAARKKAEELGREDDFEKARDALRKALGEE